MARRIGRQTVVVVPQSIDRNGDRVDGVPVEVRGCLVQPQSSTETAGANRDSTASRFIIYGPAALSGAGPGAAVDVPAEMVGGSGGATVRMEVDGQPGVWIDTRGRVDHIELTARYTRG